MADLFTPEPKLPQPKPKECMWCAANKSEPAGLYDFNNLCCRVRFLHALPNSDSREMWIDRWHRQNYPITATKNQYDREAQNDN